MFVDNSKNSTVVVKTYSDDANTTNGQSSAFEDRVAIQGRVEGIRYKSDITASQSNQLITLSLSDCFFNSNLREIIKTAVDSLLTARHHLFSGKKVYRLAGPFSPMIPGINNTSSVIKEALCYIKNQCIHLALNQNANLNSSLFSSVENRNFLAQIVHKTALSQFDFNRSVSASAEIYDGSIIVSLHGYVKNNVRGKFVFPVTHIGNSLNTLLLNVSQPMFPVSRLTGGRLTVWDDGEWSVNDILNTYRVKNVTANEIDAINLSLKDLEEKKWIYFRQADGDHIDCQWHLSQKVFNQYYLEKNLAESSGNLTVLLDSILTQHIALIMADLTTINTDSTCRPGRNIYQTVADGLHRYGGLNTQLVIGYEKNNNTQKHLAQTTISLPEYFVKPSIYNCNPVHYAGLSDYLSHIKRQTMAFYQKENEVCLNHAVLANDTSTRILDFSSHYTLKHVSMKVTSPALEKNSYSLDDKYVKCFNLRSDKYPERYIERNFPEWNYIISKFISTFSTQARRANGRLSDIPAITQALKKMCDENPETDVATAVTDLVNIYYDLLAQQNERQLSYLLTSHISQEEFCARALTKHLSIDSDHWSVFLTRTLPIKIENNSTLKNIALFELVFNPDLRSRFNNPSNPLYDENDNKLHWSSLAASLREAGIVNELQSRNTTQGLIAIFYPSQHEISSNRTFDKILANPNAAYALFNQNQIKRLVERFRLIETESSILRSANASLIMSDFLSDSDFIKDGLPVINAQFLQSSNHEERSNISLHIDDFLNSSQQQNIINKTDHFRQMLVNRYTNNEEVFYLTQPANPQGSLWRHIKDQLLQVARFIPFPPLQATVVLDDIIEGRDAETTTIDAIFAFVPLLNQIKSIKNIATILHDVASFDVFAHSIKDAVTAIKQGDYPRLAVDTFNAVVNARSPLHCAGHIAEPLRAEDVPEIATAASKHIVSDERHPLSGLTPIKISGENFYLYPSIRSPTRLYRFNPNNPSVPKPTTWFAAKEAGAWRITSGLKGGGPAQSCLLQSAEGDPFAYYGWEELINDISTQRVPATPQLIQEHIFETAEINWHDDARGYVYTGMTFRGDRRVPAVVFAEGFKLRQPVHSLAEVTGMRGGFEGGRDQQDMDGKGISTSAFYDRDRAGAWYYGGDRGGHTYVIDGRTLEGYHLYANRLAVTAPAQRRVSYHPWEINYGVDIPPGLIVGAFNRHHQFQLNPAYLAAQTLAIPA